MSKTEKNRSRAHKARRERRQADFLNRRYLLGANHPYARLPLWVPYPLAKLYAWLTAPDADEAGRKK
ncbi:hypothetical protein [Ancylobacter lacus]|uniref:hypothetical protein n=1 Tax=Ancylobacter lacus TaxID=2579970 RepID=UPI001BD07D86|nr:hypothetical protein [Ancylobacter lacus]MBS7539103.1 hypothetical protein [Ancylobacter lacus]